MGWRAVCKEGFRNSFVPGALTDCCFFSDEGSILGFLANLEILADLWSADLIEETEEFAGYQKDCFLRSWRSRLGTKLQHNVKSVMLKHRWYQRALLPSAMDDEAEGSLSFELGHWSNINRGSMVDEHCYVRDVVVDPGLMWDIPVDFGEQTLCFVCSWLFFSSFVVYDGLEKATCIANWSTTYCNVQGKAP